MKCYYYAIIVTIVIIITIMQAIIKQVLIFAMLKRVISV